MIDRAKDNRMRFLQLMADRATEGIGVVESRELDDFLASNPDIDAYGLEFAAAAVDIATMPNVTEALSGVLRDRILTDAGRFFGHRDALSAENRSEPPLVLPSRQSGLRWGTRSIYFIAAAFLLVAVLGWWQVIAPKSTSVAPSTLNYSEFLTRVPDAIRVPWVGQESGYQSVEGDVVWSQERQQGFMRFVGLEPNDPNTSQYQLWIVDPNRDQRPIDGGVFNVESTGEVVVPIDAKLFVGRPKAFAVTLEQPGGVVVSDGPLLIVGEVAS